MNSKKPLSEMDINELYVGMEVMNGSGHEGWIIGVRKDENQISLQWGLYDTGFLPIAEFNGTFISPNNKEEYAEI